MGKTDWFIPEGFPIVIATYTKEALAVYTLPKLFCLSIPIMIHRGCNCEGIPKGTHPLGPPGVVRGYGGAYHLTRLPVREPAKNFGNAKG